MKRIREWLYNKFLPAWCKDDLLEQNAILSLKLSESEQHNRQLKAYIAGMDKAMRYQRRYMTINNEVKP